MPSSNKYTKKNNGGSSKSSGSSKRKFQKNNKWKSEKRQKKNVLPPTKKERRLARSHGAEVERAKGLWNKARQKTVSEKDRDDYVKQILEIIGDALNKVSSRHDSSRIVQFCVQYGTPAQQAKILNSIKTDMIQLCKVTHGRFLVQKLFDYCKEESLRKQLLKALENKIVTLSMHSTGALVVEHLYLKGLSNKEQKYIFQEFYGAEFRHFKRKTRNSLREIVQDEPKKVDDIAEHLKSVVKKHCEKGLLSLSFVQELLFGVLHELYPSDSVKCRDISLLMLPYVKEVAPAMCTTRKGTQSLVRCIAYAPAKDRKRIVKCFKDDLFKESEPGLAQHPFAHLALLKLLDVVDDTKLLRKFILKSLKENLKVACSDRYARKLLLHMLSPGNTKYFTPSDLELLSKVQVEVDGKKVCVSKKEDSVRQNELLSDMNESLKSFCKVNASEMFCNRLACDVLVEFVCLLDENEMPVDTLVSAAFSSVSDTSLVVCDRNGQRAVCRILKSENSDAFAKALLNRLKQEDGKNLMSWVMMQKETAFLVLALLQKDCTSKSVRKDLTLKELRKIGDNPGAAALVNELSSSS